MPKPLYYTFGNHMHWVDMQWLWGHGVLPGSVRDMLHLCRETGARGNVNFDAIGYEKMAAECPDALAELREAVRAGVIEPVGCSYGQPYGLFHGGESNVRQLTYGVRTVQRLLGVRPKSFWEEEFYFFPQLPQMLAGCGFTGACLFFQWTWHTPEVPKEPHSLILWEGIDGTRLPTLPRNELNVHQWPEDFDGLLDSGLINDLDTPAIVQWLELMPSRDWMCRSEVLLPRLKALFADTRFELRPRTVSQLITDLQSPERQRGASPPPVRDYTMSDVWHGMTAGKNWDRHPTESAQCEAAILEAESLAALAGLFGRPYPRWDVYPTWELEEAWRELLAAQHHDNHECEGLCGSIAYTSLDRARSLAKGVHERTCRALFDIPHRGQDAGCVLNPFGWTRNVAVRCSEGSPQTGFVIRDIVVRDVPPFGFAQLEQPSERIPAQPTEFVEGPDSVVLKRGEFEAVVSRTTGCLTQLIGPDFGSIEFLPESFMPHLGHSSHPPGMKVRVSASRSADSLFVHASFWANGPYGQLSYRLAPDCDAVDAEYNDHYYWPRPEPGLKTALNVPILPRFSEVRIRSDDPYAAAEVGRGSCGRRKYPSGDWMTSPQWFEDVEAAFTSHSFVDILDGSDAESGRGLLVLHCAKPQWFLRDSGAAAVLNATDPWDGEERWFSHFLDPRLRIFPHAALSDSDRARLALANRKFPEGKSGYGLRDGLDMACFGALDIPNTPNILAHAFFRESPKSGEGLPDWAGHRMFRDSAGACDHPYIIRLVEWDGHPAEVLLKLPGPVALAAKTNLLGEVAPHIPGTAWLDIIPDIEPPSWAKSAKLRGRPIPWSALRFTMRPREIATIYADLLMGRKEWRDLDAKREVWATVHREPAASS